MPRIAVVSPHLDDAVLSVGGLLWLLKDHFHVEVITVFSADPPEAVSALATTLAGRFGSTISAVRRAEDEHALATLGVAHRHLGFDDAIHRTAQGSWLADDMADLFRLAPEEALIEQVARALDDCLDPELGGLLSPAGVGRHVDHLVTAAAVARTPTEGVHRLSWVDLPYGATEGQGEPRMRVPVPAAAWRAKVTAIGCYESQLAGLFCGHGDVEHQTLVMSGGQAEWFSVGALDVDPELLSLFEDLLVW
jgi:LmbE family N-acetylglucosaminyl deacetylase